MNRLSMLMLFLVPSVLFSCVPDKEPNVPQSIPCDEPPTLSDAELETTCGKAFVILRDLHCSEACGGGDAGDSFMALCERFEMDPMSNFEAKCILLHSESKESVRQCHAIRCL